MFLDLLLLAHQSSFMCLRVFVEKIRLQMNLRLSYVPGGHVHAQCPLSGLQMLFTIKRTQDSLKKRLVACLVQREYKCT